MKKRFGIDIDGTVTSPYTFIPYINSAFNLNIQFEDVKEYDLSTLVDISEEEFTHWFTENESTFYLESPLVEGAKEILKQWEKEHELYFISARASHLVDVTKEWFHKQSLRFHHLDLLGSHDKVEAAKKYKIDIFFEDKHDNAVILHEECKIPVLLFNTAYNQDPIPNGVIRVNNWNEAFQWVEVWNKS